MSNKPVIVVSDLEVINTGTHVKLAISSAGVKVSFTVSIIRSPISALKAAIADLFSLVYPDSEKVSAAEGSALKELYTFENQINGNILDFLGAQHSQWREFKDWLDSDKPDVKIIAFEGNFGKMIDELFDTSHDFDPDNQFDRTITGKALDNEFLFSHRHVLGNHFVNGRIENIKFRIYKVGSTVVLYVSPVGEEIDMNKPESVFLSNHKTNFENYMYSIFQAAR